MESATSSAGSVMQFSLRIRFMALLLCVAAVALAATVMLRAFIIRDFKQYIDGETEDRKQQVISILEGHYGSQVGWRIETLAMDLVWALQMGLETRAFDSEGKLLLDARGAVEKLPPLMKKRVLSAVEYEPETIAADFTPYPLFFDGEEIGRIELRSLHPVKEEYFIKASDRYLGYTIILLGLTSLLLAVISARKLTRPIVALSEAAEDIADGNLSRRVQGAGPPELHGLAVSFNSMADALEAQENLRRRLVSSAAHELRTPLAIISGELEGMIDGVLPVDRDGLQSMHEETLRLKQILDGVDELTRLEAGTVKLRYAEIKLKPFLETIVGRLRLLSAEKQGTILLDCPEELYLQADPDRLSQIVINLVSNSIKAISTGGRISIVAAAAGNSIKLQIHDNGCGISDKDLPYIFERFFKKGGKGLGLGLTIVKELVSAHHGNITAESRPEEGTSFEISLPKAGIA